MNPTTKQKAIRAKAEAAFAAYVRNFYDARAEDPTFDKHELDVLCRRPGAFLDGLRIYEASTPLSFEMPCVVVNCVSSTAISEDVDTSWSEAKIELHLMTQIEEGNEGTEDEAAQSNTAKSDAPKLHAERWGELIELFEDETLVMTTLNKQSAMDTRPIKSFSVFGYWKEGEQAQQFDLHWDDVLTLTIQGQPLDPY